MDKKIIVVSLAAVFSLALTAQVFASCNLVAGKTYYSDGVSFFKDSSCHQEMTASELSAGGAVSSSAAALTGSGNCRYNSGSRQYTDGVAFFTDSKCANEAINGETASEPAGQSVATTGQTSASGVSATQYAQLAQRITALETRVNVLQSMIAQILSLLAKK